MSQEHYDDWLSLYADQRKSLVDYATKLTGLRDVAEDLVQEAFAICLARSDRNYTITKAFLYTVVRNLVRNRHRHLGVRKAGHPEDYPWWARHQGITTPEAEVIILDKARLAARAIEELPPRTREVVELYRFDGLTLQQTASELGISVATAHRLLKEGMEWLWNRLDFDA